MQGTTASSSVTKFCDVPHHTVYELLVSEAAISMAARVFLGVTDSQLSELGQVDDSDAFSRTQKLMMVPKTQGICHLLPQGSSVPAVMVTLKAQLPSSVAITFDLGEGRVIVVEGHVNPESHETSRLTMSAHRTFAQWPGAGFMFR